MTWKLYTPNDKSADAWVVDEAGNFVAVGLNARLIAAAPQMRTALNSMVLNFAQTGRVTDEFVQDVARMLLEIDQ